MAKVIPGRRTHRHDGELVVFLIGMRINRVWRPDKWIPVALAMGPMLAELIRDPESGFRGYRMTLSWRGVLLVQYWSSHEKLYAYANAREQHHRPAWTAYYRRARTAAGAVGVWHETYAVASAESMYVSMPVSGLAAATESVPVEVRMRHAADRLAGGATSAPASAPVERPQHAATS